MPAVHRGAGSAIVSCGHPRAGTLMLVVDPATCEVVPNRCGGEFRGAGASVPDHPGLHTGDLDYLAGALDRLHPPVPSTKELH